MNWYYWDTDIGQAVACATSIEAAREQVMQKLAESDFARGELHEALQADPKVIEDEPFAVMAWQG
jgi:hypothetical protein